MPTQTKRSEMSDEEFGRRLVACYDDIAQLHADGGRDGDALHPMKVINGWQRECREAQDARDENSGLGPKEIERKDHGADEPPGGHGEPESPQSAKPALDSAAEAVEEGRIRNSGSANIAAQLLAARARRIDPVKVRAMSNTILGYTRIK